MLFKRCSCLDKVKCRHPHWYEFVLRGVRYRKSTRTANKQTALRIEDRRRGAILDNRDEDDDTPTLSLKKHIADYVEHTAKKNKTAYKDADVLDRFLQVVGDCSLDEVSPFHLEKWKRHRAESVARSTVNRELNIIRGCFSRAVEWERLRISPAHAVKSYKVDDHRIRVLNDNELRLALTAPADVALLCQVTLISLNRLSEVLGLHVDHIGRDWMEVRRKGGKVHRVALGDGLRAALLARCHASGFIFGEGAKGQPPTEQRASLRVVRAMRKLGLTGVSHHTFRHTGVTLMLEGGINPRAIQQLAGWSSLTMLQRYGHVRDSELWRAVASNTALLERVTAHVGKMDSGRAHTDAV